MRPPPARVKAVPHAASPNLTQRREVLCKVPE
jgi:hypothetical protein